MMNRLIVAATAGLVMASTMTGCRPVADAVGDTHSTLYTGHSGGAYAPKNTAKYDLENQAKFVLLDYDTQRSVTCSGLQERVMEDGRFQVSANIRTARTAASKSRSIACPATHTMCPA